MKTDTEWLDVIIDGRMAQINGDGDVRFYCSHDDPSWCTEKCAKRIRRKNHVKRAKRRSN